MRHPEGAMLMRTALPHPRSSVRAMPKCRVRNPAPSPQPQLSSGGSPPPALSSPSGSILSTAATVNFLKYRSKGHTLFLSILRDLPFPWRKSQGIYKGPQGPPRTETPPPTSGCFLLHLTSPPALQAHWSLWCVSNTLNMLLPQGLCTAVLSAKNCLPPEMSSPRLSLTLFDS